MKMKLICYHYIRFTCNPELSYQIETSEKLANLLESIGYEVTCNVGGNGVVALLKNGNGKKYNVQS